MAKGSEDYQVSLAFHLKDYRWISQAPESDEFQYPLKWTLADGEHDTTFELDYGHVVR